ncbi:MAG: hypothetical protein NC548_47745 [Lachnospiraceae bacterium]|nr:hypothetical protein [Lachnospiraceae bacterium]
MSKKGNSIAKNTIFLYLRMLITLCVTLYTSRVVIAALGIIDYGIYNLVAGVSSSFVFFSAALSTSTQRFLNFEMGRGNRRRVGEIFSMSVEMYTSLALIVTVVGVLLGDWLIADKLVIPADKRPEALVVLYTMLASFCMMLIASVFESALIARENMKLYAYLGITDALAKLGIAYAVMCLPDKLITYASLMVVAQLVPYAIMVIYCLRHYPECRPHWFWNKATFKEMFGFTGWNMYGSIIWMFNEQGITMLLNIFFGPVVNAARGVAASVNAAVNNFATQFFTAVRPQLVKRYAARQTAELISLIFGSTKFTVYLLWLLCLPVMLRVDYILQLWLKEVPEWTGAFVIWTLIYTIVNALNNPTYTALSATGRLRRAVLIGCNMFLLAFPLSYVALKCGLPPMAVYPLLMAGRFAFFLVSVKELKKYVPVSYSQYAVMIGLPVFKVLSVSLIVLLPINMLLPQTFPGLTVLVIVSITVCLIASLWLGVTGAERQLVIDKVRQLIKKFRK